MRTVAWTVVHPEAPPVDHHCKNCKQTTHFESSGLFRVNAQKKIIDIWLIYRCATCSTTWNCTILERANRATIDPQTLERFQENDPALALSAALDAALIKKQGGLPALPKFTVIGELPAQAEPIRLVIESDCESPLRLTAIIRRHLRLSHARLARLIESQVFTCEDGSDLSRKKLGRQSAIVVANLPDQGAESYPCAYLEP